MERKEQALAKRELQIQQFLEEIKALVANEKQRHKTDVETLRTELAKAKTALQEPRWKGYPCERDGPPRCHVHHRVGYCQRELGLKRRRRNCSKRNANSINRRCCTTSARRDYAPLLRAPARQGCCRSSDGIQRKVSTHGRDQTEGDKGYAWVPMSRHMLPMSRHMLTVLSLEGVLLAC